MAARRADNRINRESATDLESSPIPPSREGSPHDEDHAPALMWIRAQYWGAWTKVCRAKPCGFDDRVDARLVAEVPDREASSADRVTVGQGRPDKVVDATRARGFHESRPMAVSLCIWAGSQKLVTRSERRPAIRQRGGASFRLRHGSGLPEGRHGKRRGTRGLRDAMVRRSRRGDPLADGRLERSRSLRAGNQNSFALRTSETTTGCMSIARRRNRSVRG